MPEAYAEFFSSFASRKREAGKLGARVLDKSGVPARSKSASEPFRSRRKCVPWNNW